MENSDSSCVDDPGSIFLETISVDGSSVTLCKEVEGDKVELEVDNTVLASALQDESTESYVPLAQYPVPVALITLADGMQALVAPESFLDKNTIDLTNVTMVHVEQDTEQEQTEVIESIEAPPVAVEANIIQLENGRFAYIHDQPQDGCHMVKMEDGSTAYITLTRGLLEEETVSTEAVEVEGNLQVDEKKSSKTSFRCLYPDCGRLYSTMHHLKVHERSHTGTRPYLCTEKGCTKAFATDYGRKAHVRTHTGEKPYHCKEPECNKSFKTSGDLQKHTRTHTGERPFLCPVSGCDRSFTTSNIRKVHIRTHTGEKPYVCTHPGCDRSFASATNFKNHMRIHSGEKPYVCEWPSCQKRFTEYSSLYKHHMVHTKQKPYRCNICDHNYRQVSTLTVHKRTAHGVIAAEDGTEIVLGDMFGVSGTKKLKNLASNLLNLSREKRGTLVTLQSGSGIEEQNQIYILTGDNLDQAIQSIDEDAELEAALEPLTG
ncbi:uncharacterized protein LOC142320582 [Lycorma delicatula]|uniref:uncharacterized protein LOC142320582 n=1 Tax=Lycorma delicatula TaxID=130591 RepID=UPI003F5199E4